MGYAPVNLSFVLKIGDLVKFTICLHLTESTWCLRNTGHSKT